jgi:hypothetical protein
MLSVGALDLVMSLASGVVKLAGRLDLLMAESEAVTGPLVIPRPEIQFAALNAREKLKALREYLESTRGLMPHPLGSDLAKLSAVVDDEGPGDAVQAYFGRIFPERNSVAKIDLEAEFIRGLRARMPALNLDDPETRLAAFYVMSGKDRREIGYVTRTAFLVADVVAELGVENASRFIRHEPTRDLVKGIVGRFAQPDLENFTDWSPLLRHALGAALDGLQENRHALGAAPWLDAVLSAVVAARDDPAAGVDFVTGLVNGQGYRRLFSKGLLLTAERLGPDGAASYGAVVADVLRSAAVVVKDHSGNFRSFFNDHWGELLRATLSSVERHGIDQLQGAAPLAREVTVSLIKELSGRPNLGALSGETVFRLADAALGAAARKRSLLAGAEGVLWLKQFVDAGLNVLGDRSLAQRLTRDGVERIMLQALGSLAEHPELLGGKPGAQLEMAGKILQTVSAAGTFHGMALADAAVNGLLEQLGRRPHLADTRFGEIVVAFSKTATGLVATGTLTGRQAAELMRAAQGAVLRNPTLFAHFDDELASVVVSGVLAGVRSGNAGFVAGATLVAVIEQTLQTVAQRGVLLLERLPGKGDLETMVDKTVAAGIRRAEAEMGRGIDTGRLPFVLSGLVSAVARGELTQLQLDADAPQFQSVFGRLCEVAA